MWNKWEHEKGKALKAEKYKEKAFIDIYKIDEHYEIICSISEHIIFHTIFSYGTEERALKKYENVKKDLEHIVDTPRTEDEMDDLCYEFIEKW